MKPIHHARFTMPRFDVHELLALMKATPDPERE